MRIRQTTESDEGIISLSSLIDVMFILLIFFMATTTFKREERDLKVRLPESSAKKSLSAASKLMVINVRSADRTEGDPLYLVSQKKMSLAQLRQTIAREARENSEQKVLIRGDRRAFHGDVAAAVTACYEAGIKEANIAYDKKVTG